MYASVQAHLKQPLYFPGDYLAWDKVIYRFPSTIGHLSSDHELQEFCESSAGLNSLLSEWAVLTPEAGNEAFNAQDGLAFTWSRLWPYLASYVGIAAKVAVSVLMTWFSWFGTTWEHPEDDESKYQTFYSRAGYNPRGYGPRGSTRMSSPILLSVEEVAQYLRPLVKFANTCGRCDILVDGMVSSR